MIISTQEPTISTSLLNLCSTTIVHRFTSPEWLRALQKHLAGAAQGPSTAQTELKADEISGKPSSLFNEIVGLSVGEALVFAPSAIIGATVQNHGRLDFTRLGHRSLLVKIRQRLTSDGGRSVLSL